MAAPRWSEEEMSEGTIIDDVSPRRQPLCLFCNRLKSVDADGKGVCEAFPNGIPDTFWSARADHITPYDGDKGITFTPYTS